MKLLMTHLTGKVFHTKPSKKPSQVLNFKMILKKIKKFNVRHTFAVRKE
jgi:hypothetical protein